MTGVLSFYSQLLSTIVSSYLIVHICSFSNRELIRLTDAGQNNATFWCRHCSVEFDPESENVRRDSKFSSSR
jgi:hypothetical protein